MVTMTPIAQVEGGRHLRGGELREPAWATEIMKDYW